MFKKKKKVNKKIVKEIGKGALIGIATRSPVPIVQSAIKSAKILKDEKARKARTKIRNNSFRKKRY
tara:strand:- start:57 stop:254 length:198 start_codon:yes stop_codon:yes gene_type:complete